MYRRLASRMRWGVHTPPRVLDVGLVVGTVATPAAAVTLCRHHLSPWQRVGVMMGATVAGPIVGVAVAMGWPVTVTAACLSGVPASVRARVASML